jgi:hypothetical protein
VKISNSVIINCITTCDGLINPITTPNPVLVTNTRYNWCQMCRGVCVCVCVCVCDLEDGYWIG